MGLTDFTVPGSRTSSYILIYIESLVASLSLMCEETTQRHGYPGLGVLPGFRLIEVGRLGLEDVRVGDGVHEVRWTSWRD